MYSSSWISPHLKNGLPNSTCKLTFSIFTQPMSQQSLSIDAIESSSHNKCNNYDRASNSNQQTDHSIYSNHQSLFAGQPCSLCSSSAAPPHILLPARLCSQTPALPLKPEVTVLHCVFSFICPLKPTCLSLPSNTSFVLPTWGELLFRQLPPFLKSKLS